MKVGFIGLGLMGRGMANGLLKGGVDLLVNDISADAKAALVTAGATGATDLAELTRAVDVIFTSLPGPAEVEQVVFGPGGIIENLQSEQVMFDLTTSSREMACKIDAAFRSRGAWFLDAPVSGGPAGAASGDLAIWVGGERAVYDRHLDLLKKVGRMPRHVGPVGAGTVVKLAHNMSGYMIMASLAEVFSVATKAGVDPLELWEAMHLGMVGRASPMDMLVRQFLPGAYEPPAFALRLAHKDVALGTLMARELGVPMRIANMTFAEMTEALGRGWGNQDSRAFLKLQLERAGVQIAVEPERLARAVEDAKR
jgi:3-hydroxyisobutyrate dehydrogenase